MVCVPSSSSGSTEYYINSFLNAVRADLDSPVTSNFGNRINEYRSQAQRFVEGVEEDNLYFTPMRKISKDIENSLTTLSKQFDELGIVTKELAEKWRQRSIESLDDGAVVLTNMGFLFKGECDLIKEQVRNWINNMVHPLDLLCSAPSELKHKAVDKACREYESKFAKAESEAKRHAKQSGHPRSQVSHGELAEELTTERVSVEYELCKFMLNMGAMEDKKSCQLVRHFMEFLRNQNEFYSEGQRLNVEFRRACETLENVMDIRSANSCQQRNALFELKTRLESTYGALRINTTRRARADSYSRSSRLSLADVYGGTSTSSLGISTFASGENESLQDVSGGSYSQLGSPLPAGFLYKKSNKKLHKQWQKRKCRIEDGCFWLSHSDESLPPAKLSLLVSDCKPSPDGSRMFDLYCRDRTYHLQAETEAEAKKWVIALKQEIQRLKRELLNSESECGEVNISGSTGREWNKWKKCVSAVRNLPGNHECADCGSDVEVQWLSNTGALVCIDCSGAHRDLGVHVSRIQSLDLDVISPVEFLVPLATGNTVINRIYESDEKANLWKPRPGCSGIDRQNFIQQKYRDRRFVLKINDPDSQMRKAMSDLNVEQAYRALLSQNVSPAVYTEDKIFFEMIRQNNPMSLPIVQLCAQFGVFDPVTQMPILTQCVEAENVDALCLFLYNRFGNGKQNFPSLKPLEELASKLGYSEILEVLRDAQTPGRCRLNQVTIPSALIKSASSSGSLSQSSSISPLAHPPSEITVDSSSSSVNVLMRNGTTITVPKESSDDVQKGSHTAVDRRSASPSGNSSRPSSAQMYSCSTYPPLSACAEKKELSAATSLPSQVPRGQLSRSISKLGNRVEVAQNLYSQAPFTVNASSTGRSAGFTSQENEPSSVPSSPVPTLPAHLKPKPYHRSASEYNQAHTCVGAYRETLEQKSASSSVRKKQPVGYCEDKFLKPIGMSTSFSMTSSSISLDPLPSSKKIRTGRSTNVLFQDSTSENMGNFSFKKDILLPSTIQSGSDSAHQNGVDNHQATFASTERSRFSTFNPVGVEISENQCKQPVLQSDSCVRGRVAALTKAAKGVVQCGGVKVKPPIPTPRRTVASTDISVQKECVRRCRALYDCIADNPDELSFKRGDIIVVSKERIIGENDTWMEGYLASEPQKKGVFPITFVTFQT